MTAARTRELLLLVLALGASVLAFIAVGLGVDGKVPSDVLRYGGGLSLIYLLAHLAVRRFAPRADPVLLPCAALLNGFGLAIIHRIDIGLASAARAAGRPAPRGDASLQLAWTLAGLILFVAVLVLIRDHRVLQRYRYTLMALGIGLLVLPAVLPASISEVNGARIWIRLGPLSFQPGEAAKILLTIFFAAYFSDKRELLSLAGRRFAGMDLPRPRDLGPVLVAWGITLGVLFLESDLGTGLLFFGLFIAVLYVATERVSWLVIGLLMFAAASSLAYVVVAHIRERVEIWLHPFHYASTYGYQLVQGLFGFANGGLFGTGLGRGHPTIVPFVNTDFVASAIGEELGLVGLAAILVVFGLLVSRGFRAALTTADPFGKLLAAGLAFAVALQVFVQVGGVMRLIPLAGLTLPFVSYGGSSLVGSWALVALLMRISDDGQRPAPMVASSPVLTEAATQVVRT